MNTFSLEQKPKTGNLDCNLVFRQYKLDLMAMYMESRNLSTQN